MASSAEQELRRFLTELLATLDLDRPVDAYVMADRVGDHFGRPVVVRTAEFPTANASGVVLKLPEPDRYMVALQEAATAGHRAHVLFHELMHIVRGHLEGDPTDQPTITCRGVGSGPQGAAALAPDPPTSAADLAEWEAEVGATILSRWSRKDPERQGAVGGDPGVSRFASALMGAPWT